MRQSVDTDEESEIEVAMIKRSEIAMRGRTDNGSSANADGLRQSMAGFPALFISQADINMNSEMNQRILGMFMRNEGSE